MKDITKDFRPIVLSCPSCSAPVSRKDKCTHCGAFFAVSRTDSHDAAQDFRDSVRKSIMGMHLMPDVPLPTYEAACAHARKFHGGY